MISTSLIKKYDAEAAEALDELIRESLRTLLVVTAIAAWVWAVFVFLFVKPMIPYALYAVLLLALFSGAAKISFNLSRKNLDLAVGTYLFSLILGVTIIVLVFQNPDMLYLYMPVLLIAITLTNPTVTWGASLGTIVLILVISKISHSTQPADIVLPITFILLTALTSALSWRRLLTALGWALSMTQETRKNAEEARVNRAEVKRVLKSLDEAYVRLKRANQALIFAQEAAEKAYQFKAEFVANVSHELRTPLNLIVGFSKMMATAPESYGGVSLPSQYRGDVMALYRSARHLSALVDDVLDLSQIEAGSMPLVKETTDLGGVIGEVIEMVHGLIEARGLRLELDLADNLPQLYLDRTRIRQVLLNLLTNATRFTEKGVIRIQTRIEDQEVMVAVEDSGRGIPPDKIAAAFEAFSQVDDGRSFEGSGLGLAVSKRFIELHGGDMWIDSEVGRGTTIGLTIPIPQDEKEIPRIQFTGSSPSRHEHEPLVLVLHDDSRVLSLLHRHVGGYQFVLAQTLDQAIEMIPVVLPVAVIIDTNWADYRTDLTQELNLLSSVPLVTCPLPNMLRLGSLLGVANYLTKPVTEEDLESALSRFPEPPQTVLVIDDNPDVVRLLGRMLKSNRPSLRVLEAFGGKEGLEIARSEKPDVMLLDIVMPNMNGYAVLEEMTIDETMAKIQVIIISAHNVEAESIPLKGEIRVGHQMNFSLSDISQILQSTLPVITRSAVMAPDSAVIPLEVQLDQPV